MDEQSTRLKTGPERTKAGALKNPAAEVNRLRTEIEDARDGLGVYVTELDRRRHKALDLKRQLRKHKALGIGVGAMTLAAAAGAVARVVGSRRKAAQALPGSPRPAPTVPSKSRRLGRFLLATAVPKALKAVRGVLQRATSRRPRLA
jgi:hypothetical protein